MHARSSAMVINPNYFSWSALKVNLWADAVTLRMFGNDYVRAKYNYFRSPHPRFPLVPRKSLGVALIELQGSYADHVRLRQRSEPKRKSKMALKHKYTYEKLRGIPLIDEVMDINESLSLRQGREMPPIYFDRKAFEKILSESCPAHVVRCPMGKIVGYILVPNIGDVWLVDYILGHGDHLKNGIMYLLMNKVIEEKFELAKAEGSPHWLMYDTLLGAGEGLRYFKGAMGFSPYWVRWKWGHAP
jgi:hypothetical protein